MSQLFRVRGRMHDLETNADRSVGGLGDVEEFIQSSFAAPDREVRWEAEP